MRAKISSRVATALIVAVFIISTHAASAAEGDDGPAATLPSFTAVTIDGDVVNTQKLRGKVVLLDFWGTWCKPCQAAIPHLRELASELEDEPFVIVGIAADTNLGAVRRYTESRGMTWPQILDADRRFSAEVFQVPSYPTYLLFDHEGTAIFQTSGFSRRTKKKVDRAVREALEELKSAD